MRPLDLVPVDMGDRSDLVETLSGRLRHALRTTVLTRHAWFDPEDCFEPSRGQHHATLLLGKLLEDPEQRDTPVLAVTSVDLFIPVLTYVFGEAQLGGRAAVVSIHRLRPEAYGLPRDDVLLADRLTKEAIHELGHTLGLLHCLDSGCVMRSSTYVEEIDLKSDSFCDSCRAAIG